MQFDQLALIWDMDGTIIDTKDVHFLTLKETFEKHGYTLDKATFDVNFGRNNQTTFPLYLGFDPDPTLMEQLIQEKEEHFRQIAPKKSTLIPGVRSWIETAKAHQIPQVIASSAEIENIQTMLTSFSLLSFFEAFIAGDNLPAKPEPDIFLKAAKTLHRSPEHCLVIEDSPSGVKAAKNADMLVVAVTATFSRSELSLADLLLPDFTIPLEDALRKINII
jgi:HAD superfamily hydrolase (TIGR01509 family)